MNARGRHRHGYSPLPQILLWSVGRQRGAQSRKWFHTVVGSRREKLTFNVSTSGAAERREKKREKTETLSFSLFGFLCSVVAKSQRAN
ncbi:hypothetical protein F2P81_008333 [Scophthalmus maximus]|uniref:Uncharacterized protein n=1 Tax=Scophthalmus maximus TaxID=52904 RepID=A0A6A4T703_SCOMX|nr:hypothetical protein F2P81_008333 [Scophthalmus maximus]